MSLELSGTLMNLLTIVGFLYFISTIIASLLQLGYTN